MSLPSLPTDNLYKFVAIFGLIVTLYSGYIYFKEFSYRNQYGNYVEYEGQKLNKKYDEFLELLQAKIDSHELNQLKLKELRSHNENEYKYLFEYSSNELKELDLWYDQEKKELELLKGNYLRNSNNLSNTQFQYLVNIFILSGLLLTGIYLIRYGFVNWYDKHQKYIDAEIKYKGMEYIEKIKQKEFIEKKDDN